MKAEINDDGDLEVIAETKFEAMALKGLADEYMSELLPDCEFPIALNWGLINTTVTISTMTGNGHTSESTT